MLVSVLFLFLNTFTLCYSKLVVNTIIDRFTRPGGMSSRTLSSQLKDWSTDIGRLYQEFEPSPPPRLATAQRACNTGAAFLLQPGLRGAEMRVAQQRTAALVHNIAISALLVQSAVPMEVSAPASGDAGD